MTDTPAQSAAQGVSASVQAAYDEQYTDAMTEWRETGGKAKAQNILDVCEGHAFGKVLDCGAGEGSVLKFLDESGRFAELAAAEISDSGIARIRARTLPRVGQVEKFDGYRLPFPDRAFDLAYCTHVLEHVEHPRILLRELKRVAVFQVFEVPLDYAIGLDANVHAQLAYGHINVFTPTLFRFLVKSEGFEIVAEKRSQASDEVLRYIWYRNMKKPRTFASELGLRMLGWRRAARRMLRSRRYFDEFGYSAYTCLARGVGALKVF